MFILDFIKELNIFDISFIAVSILSLFLAIKNGFLKSTLNLLKWILLIYIIKHSFYYIRPILDSYVQNQTIADIIILISVLIISFILLTIATRIMIAIIEPKNTGLVAISLSAVMGIFRAYIIFVIIIFFINTNVNLEYISNLIDESEFREIMQIGVTLIGDLPERIDDLTS